MRAVGLAEFAGRNQPPEALVAWAEARADELQAHPPPAYVDGRRKAPAIAEPTRTRTAAVAAPGGTLGGVEG